MTAIEPTMRVPSSESPRRGGRSGAFFSFPVALAASLVALTALSARSRLNDPDLWWQLKTGEIIWNTRSIPRVDLFSHTTHQHAWIPHEWLSQATIYAAYHWGGYSGLMLWLCVAASALLVLQYAFCSLYAGNAKVALAGALTTWYFATIGLSVRPQLLGYLWLVAELFVLHLGRTRSPRWLLTLPILFVVWVNCHGSYSVGLIVLAIFTVCSRFRFRRGSLAGEAWDPRRRALLTAAFGLSALATLVNPVGLQLVLYPLDAVLNQTVGLASVQEWQPLDPSDPRAIAMGICAALVLVRVLLNGAVLRCEEALLFVFGFLMAVRHTRLLFAFGVLAAPVISRLLADAWEGYDRARDRKLPNAILIALSLGVAWGAFPSSSALNAQVTSGNPVQAVEFIRRTGLSGRMLNEYVYGGYLIWALPEHPVFIDGRADVYEWTGVFADFGSWMMLRSDPRELLDRYHVDFCLLARDSAIVRLLPYLPGWNRIYEDDRSVIFARSGRN